MGQISMKLRTFAPIFDIDLRPFLTTFGEVKIGSISTFAKVLSYESTFESTSEVQYFRKYFRTKYESTKVQSTFVQSTSFPYFRTRTYLCTQLLMHTVVFVNGE